MAGHKASGHNKMMEIAEAGLSADEMKIAHGMKMSKAEHAVMHKRMAMCMADKHKGMDMSKMDDKMGMAHMMSGLTKGQQKTMMGMMSKMSPEQMAVTKKMMMKIYFEKGEIDALLSLIASFKVFIKRSSLLF